MSVAQWSGVGLVVILAAVVPARVEAHCPGGDGTLPGGPRVYTVGAGDAAVYVDDRDFLDLDEDGDAGGLWIYMESNGEPGLQRGAAHITESLLPGTPDPIEVLPPDPQRPVFPNGLTLFPGGFSGCGWGASCYPIFVGDHCDDSAGPPDMLLF